jgi:hypothetical protein
MSIERINEEEAVQNERVVVRSVTLERLEATAASVYVILYQ